MEKTFLPSRGKAWDERVLVCEPCSRLETACYICKLPVKDRFTKLADGRLLCEDHAKQAVLEQTEASRIFEEVKGEALSLLMRMGSLPHRNIQVILEAKPRLDKSGGDLISAHDDRLLMGLTRSVKEKNRFQHRIHLLHGLTRERMTLVAAHEYAHAWLHENVQRKLNDDTAEVSCDWLAYKVLARRTLAGETKVLLQNDYSAGQLQAFLTTASAHGFYRVIQWVKHGVDPELDVKRPERLLVLRKKGESAPEPLLTFAAAPVPQAGPTNLVLKGLSGSGTRRFALINDGTFALHERGKVKVGFSNVIVQCLQIRGRRGRAGGG